MARILYGIIAVVASFMLADSLTCNSCSLHVLGQCINPSEATCPQNSTECFTTLATFPSLNSSFAGIRTLGCTTSTTCNTTTDSTLLGVAYQTLVTCCSTDKCNTIISGAPTTKLSITAALSAAVLASVWGTMIY